MCTLGILQIGKKKSMYFRNILYLSTYADKSAMMCTTELLNVYIRNLWLWHKIEMGFFELSSFKHVSFGSSSFCWLCILGIIFGNYLCTSKYLVDVYCVLNTIANVYFITGTLKFLSNLNGRLCDSKIYVSFVTDKSTST